jgi:hypothetical protein
LQRALAARGFSGSHLTVQHATGGTATESSRQSKGEDPRSQDRGRGSEGSNQEDGSQDSWGGSSRTSQRERGKR